MVPAHGAPALTTVNTQRTGRTSERCRPQDPQPSTSFQQGEGVGTVAESACGDVTGPRQPIAGGLCRGHQGGGRPAGGAVARRVAPQSRHSRPPSSTQRLRRRLRAVAMADVEDGEETCALSSHSGSAGSKSGSDKMFSLKKWNAVAMWSWDVECDTCAICRVQVMGKLCTRGLGRPTASAGRLWAWGRANGRGDSCPEESRRGCRPRSTGRGVTPVLWPPPGTEGSLDSGTVPEAGFFREKRSVNRGIKQDNFR